MKTSWAAALIVAVAAATAGIAVAQEDAAPAASEASAETQTATGIVRDLDRRSQTITISPGGVFKTPEGWSRRDIREGAVVQIRYTTNGDERTAVSIIKGY